MDFVDLIEFVFQLVVRMLSVSAPSGWEETNVTVSIIAIRGNVESLTTGDPVVQFDFWYWYISQFT